MCCNCLFCLILVVFRPRAIDSPTHNKKHSLMADYCCITKIVCNFKTKQNKNRNKHNKIEKESKQNKEKVEIDVKGTLANGSIQIHFT
eukprot:UN15298